MRPRLLALDVDGTLLRDDGTIDPRDAAAIARARTQGITVTLATGRLATGSLHLARELGLDVPLVCADGATLVEPRTGAFLEGRTLALEVVEAILRVLDAHALPRFVFTHETIHADAIARPLLGYVTAWTPDVRFHDAVHDARAPWRADPSVTMAIGIGDEASVSAARARLARELAESADAVHFGLRGGDFAVRVHRRGTSKADGLERLCGRLGVAREDVAVVGDWLNDLSMFAWAGRSFAMGQAPSSVRAAASDRLDATSAEGGGVAEAIARWLR